jgi:nucleosome binding factor SPN SPT16 subunit
MTDLPLNKDKFVSYLESWLVKSGENEDEDETNREENQQKLMKKNVEERRRSIRVEGAYIENNADGWAPSVVSLSEVEHCHLERVSAEGSSFDIVVIFRHWELPPQIIQGVEMKYLEIVQDWLNSNGITFTKGPKSLNWSEVMKFVRSDREYFYETHDKNGAYKPAGWLFLSPTDEDSDNEA